MERATEKLVKDMDIITRDRSLSWQEKREQAEKLNLSAYEYATEESKKARFRLMVACRNPADLGKDGKMLEASLRILRSFATKRPLNNSAFYAHGASIDDTRITIDGKQVRIEIKSGAGDWFRTQAGNVADALDEYRAQNKLLIWKTNAFTIVLPFAEFLDRLEEYNEKGAGQFFKSCLKTGTAGNVLQLQEWRTSKKKIRFLQQVARHSYNLKELLINSRLVRRG